MVSKLVEKAYGSDVVGSRVRICFAGDGGRPWCEGRVVEYNEATERHSVLYDDGEQRTHDLGRAEASKQLQWTKAAIQVASKQDATRASECKACAGMHRGHTCGFKSQRGQKEGVRISKVSAVKESPTSAIRKKSVTKAKTAASTAMSAATGAKAAKVDKAVMKRSLFEGDHGSVVDGTTERAAPPKQECKACAGMHRAHTCLRAASWVKPVGLNALPAGASAFAGLRPNFDVPVDQLVKRFGEYVQGEQQRPLR